MKRIAPKPLWGDAPCQICLAARNRTRHERLRFRTFYRVRIDEPNGQTWKRCDKLGGPCAPDETSYNIIRHCKMGYDLHITRRPEWSDDGGPEITLEEWMAYVDSDEELGPDADNGPTDFLWTGHPQEPWPLWWDRGEIYTKNPDEFTIRKLAAIAEQLSAKIQGDDGEVYRADGAATEPEPATSPSAARPTFLSRIGSWFRRRSDARELQQEAPAFCVGQRVKDPWGAVGTVLDVDRDANGGLGNVRVRFDDGREHDSTCFASGLEIVRDARGGG